MCQRGDTKKDSPVGIAKGLFIFIPHELAGAEDYIDDIITVVIDRFELITRIPFHYTPSV